MIRLKKKSTVLIANGKKRKSYKITNTGSVYSLNRNMYLKIIESNDGRAFHLNGEYINLDIALIESFYPKIAYLLKCGVYLTNTESKDVHNFSLIFRSEYIDECKKNDKKIKLSYFDKKFISLLRTKENLNMKEISDLMNLTQTQVYKILKNQPKINPIQVNVTQSKDIIEVMCMQYIQEYKLQNITWKDLYNIIME